jgi:hypothetical protein
MYDIVQTTLLLGPAANGASSIAASQGQRQGYLETCLNGGTDPIGQHFGALFPADEAEPGGWRLDGSRRS